MRFVVYDQEEECEGRFLIRAQPARPSRETIGGSEITFRALVSWATKYKLEEAGTQELLNALEEARRACPECTVNDAVERVKAAAAPEELATTDPFRTISSSLDWNRITSEEELKGEALEASETVKAALEQGLIQPRDIGLYRRPQRPPGVVGPTERQRFQSEIEEYERRVRDLEQRLREAQQAKVTPLEERVARASNEYIRTRAAQEGLTGDEVFLLTTAIRPELTLEENRRRIDELIRSIIMERGPPPMLAPPGTEMPPPPPPRRPPERISPSAVVFPGMVFVPGVGPVPILGRAPRPLRPAVPIPAECEVVETFALLEDAHREALSRKLREPERLWGYAYDELSRRWAVIVCERAPENSMFTEDDLLIIVPPEEEEE
jgi:hypothetical protein